GVDDAVDSLFDGLEKEDRPAETAPKPKDSRPGALAFTTDRLPTMMHIRRHVRRLKECALRALARKGMEFEALDVTFEDPDFGPWYGFAPLQITRQNVNVLPAEAGGEGVQEWPFVRGWRVLGPFLRTEPLRIETVNALPEIVPTADAGFRTQLGKAATMVPWTGVATAPGSGQVRPWERAREPPRRQYKTTWQPAVSKGEVYVMDRSGRRKDILLVLDLQTGKERWRFSYDAYGRLGTDGGSRTVPTVHNGYVYTMGPMGHLHCIDRKTHKAMWSRNIVREFGGWGLPRTLRYTSPRWGVTQHPLVYRDTVLAAPHRIDAGIVAFDIKTGKTKWRSSDIGLHIFGHVSPSLVTLSGVNQVIMVANKDNGMDPPAIVSGVDAATGKLLWQVFTPGKYNVPMPSPVPVGNDRLFVTGGYTIGCLGLDVARDGPAWTARYGFKDNDNCSALIHTPVFYKGHLYAQSFDAYHSKENNGLTCLDTDGKLQWKTGPKETFDYGNLLIADGMIYVINGESGEISLVEATPAGYKLLARHDVVPDEGQRRIWAPMALANGKLIIRDNTRLVCLDVRKP
ncbi:PQQ-binding-like beta-propeller repeat protein, partial [Verrucomicrobiota bacterium]